MLRVVALPGDPPDEPVTSPIWTEQPRSYGLNRTDLENIPPEDVNPLREWWANQHDKGATLYATNPQGQVFKIVPDGNGMGITTTRYEYQETETLRYEGPDAWKDVEDSLGQFQVIPTNPAIQESNVEAHANLMHNPIWFKVVQRLVGAIDKADKNPYRRK